MARLSTAANTRQRSRLLVSSSSSGGASASNVLATGGTVTTDTPTEVTHEFTADGTFAMIDPGILPVTFTISATGSYDGNTSTGAGYVGTPMEIVVTSGTVTVTYDPTDLVALAANEAWFAADVAASITDTTGDVTAWADLSNNNNDLPSVTGTPRTGDATINGRNVLTFAGAERLYGTPASVLGTADLQLFMFVDWGTPGTFAIPPLLLTSGTTGRPFDRWSNASEHRFTLQTNTVTGFTALRSRTAAELYRLTIDKDGAAAGNHTISEHFDGTLTAGPTNRTATWSTASQVISVGARPDAATDFRGNLAEILAFNRVLAAGDIATVEGYIAFKWVP